MIPFRLRNAPERRTGRRGETVIQRRQDIIYTDLDGTFLDARTYSCGASLPALQAALRQGVAVVFCSSKTHGEIQELLADLRLTLPFISENGGGIFIPEGYFPLSPFPRAGSWRVLSLGTEYPALVRALAEIGATLGVELRGFSDMSEEEVAEICNFGSRQAALAKMRRYDEPFVVASRGEDIPARVGALAAAGGLQVTRGGRFFHLTGANDKGVAVRRLNRLYREEHAEIFTAGLGDSANDIPLLAAVDRPVLVQKHAGEYDPAVVAALPGIERAPGIGPEGWAIAVMNLLEKQAPGNT